METYYILIVGFLFFMAVFLLIVGVSNDAVNFLNSAIGAKAAPYKIILAVAGIGVLVGAVFSNGMMEVARKGIFNPEYFTFSELMVVFLAVMLTNILLLDFFNTLGLPTSTTISIVFGILGSAVQIAIYKITRDHNEINIGDYINIENSGIIIIGIFLSVVVAFSAGTVVQWIVRLAFSFNIKNSYKYWSGIWGGFAITAILYFLLMKGAKGSTLVTAELLKFISSNTKVILLTSFIVCSFILQFLVIFTRVNILKIIVLLGTFALAMAFAGNDLVNFIGLPLAGFESFKVFTTSAGSDPDGLLMSALREPVSTPINFLVIAGLIMILTLRFSSKARTVTATTIDLSRQGEGAERFASTTLARFIVRRSIEFSNLIDRITPASVDRFFKKRFNEEQIQEDKQEKVAFDLVRASVNLVVASILISVGTSNKLPLSTTYVTFMVAMGSSLSDGAWGRDSAVYRITGVLTVVGGWFFTAFTAFLAAFIISAMIFFGKLPVIIILTGISIYILFKTHNFHLKKSEKDAKVETGNVTQSIQILKELDKSVKTTVAEISQILYNTYISFFKEKHKDLIELRKNSKQLSKLNKKVREDIPHTLRKFEETELETGHHYVQVVTYLNEMCNSMTHIIQPAFDHLDNNHAFDKEQIQKLKEFNEQLKEFFKVIISHLDNRSERNFIELNVNFEKIISLVNELIVTRVKIMKKSKKGVKLSVTYIEMLYETKNLLQTSVNLVKANSLLSELLYPEKVLNFDKSMN